MSMAPPAPDEERPSGATGYGATSAPGGRPAGAVRTYVAGEDAGRLAASARELGLARPRDPRPNVRHERTLSLRRLNASTRMVRAAATRTIHATSPLLFGNVKPLTL